MLQLATSAEIGISARFAPKGKDNAAQFALPTLLALRVGATAATRGPLRPGARDREPASAPLVLRGAARRPHTGGAPADGHNGDLRRQGRRRGAARRRERRLGSLRGANSGRILLEVDRGAAGLELLGMLELAASAEIDIFTRYTLTAREMLPNLP